MVGSKKFNVFRNFLGGAMLTAVQTYNISSCIPHPHVIAKWALDPMDLSGPIFSRIYGYNNPAIGWIKLYYYEIRDKWFGVDGICTVEKVWGWFFRNGIFNLKVKCISWKVTTSIQIWGIKVGLLTPKRSNNCTMVQQSWKGWGIFVFFLRKKKQLFHSKHHQLKKKTTFEQQIENQF